MENVLKKPYEISIWEDFTPSDDKKYYQERKLMIIGSDTMTARLRATNPIFKTNLNGTHTLTFTLYSRYFDEEQGDFADNPFLPYMVNERKVKLKYDGEWYDFIIKDIDESSTEDSYTYTCTDSFINELSKNGFSIELDTELENNQGTIGELAATVLEGTDWKIGHIDTLVQKNDEALYATKILHGTTIKAVDMMTLQNESPTYITITSKEDLTGVEVEPIIYVFYSSAMDSTIPMQFLYREDGDYQLDEEGVVNNAPNYLLVEGVVSVNTENGAVNDFRGKRIVQKEITKYDALIDHYITVYEDGNKEQLYMYYENEYISPTIVNNYVANSINFTNTSGWNPSIDTTVKNTLYPPMYTTEYVDTTFVPYMRLHYDSNNPIYNAGIISNTSYMSKGIAEGERYIFRVKYGVANSETGKPAQDGNNRLRAKVAEYSLSTDGMYNLNNGEILSFVGATPIKEEETLDEDSGLYYVYYIASAKKSVSYSDLKSTKNPIGLFFSLNTPDSNNFYFIQEAQFFPLEEDANGTIVFPGDTPSSCVKKKYFYYYPSKNKTAKDADSVSYAYIGYDKPEIYKVKYDKTFEKIRSINAKESNRFNIIQSLCETFECWALFKTEHNEDGSIAIGADGPNKTVNFYEYVGNENYSGFKYGINLKSVKRTLDSEQIVSKIIVKPNSNEYGVDGYCSIARATENPIRENFLLNFRYYISQGLLDGNEVNNDLYLYTDGGKYLGYYVQLNKINKQYDDYILEHSLIETELTNLEANYTTYKVAYDEAVKSLNENLNTIKNYCGVSYNQLIAAPDTYKRYLGNKEVQDLITQITSWTNQAKQFEAYYTQKQKQIDQQNNRLEEIEKAWKELLVQKDELDYKFYQKYAKYIQEGSWISEDYMDDNLYYLDAESVLYNSAFPDVSYTIDVLELSQLEGYENYNFSIGDKTYVEDTEFFGYKYIDGIKTPYQEEVILSEITYNLDDPSSNQIKVQNYKTQFEDLFQRITATTQSLQFSTGNYQRAAASFNTNGSINQSTLQSSMINNSLILSNASDQSVVWDDTGITITNLSKPNEIVRLVSGGILITSDGGETWSAGITGQGINTNYLTAGQIDAGKINIISGGFPSFRWDTNGLTAYRYELDKDTGLPTNFQFNNFVRLDQYGIYGVKHDSDFVASSIEEVKENAQFGLTWDGFFLKTDHGANSGHIEISTEEDFQVFGANNTPRIKIGLLPSMLQLDGSKKDVFGMQLYDENGIPTLSTTDEGVLWLANKMAIGPVIVNGSEGLKTRYNYRAQFGIVDTWKAGTGPLATEGVESDYSLILQIQDNEVSSVPSIQLYDTGLLVAKNANIKGHIEATSGKIGNMDINSFSENMMSVSIVTNTGTTIKQSVSGVLSPNEMKFTAKPVGLDTTTATYFYWRTSSDGEHWVVLGDSVLGTVIEYDDDGNEIVRTGDGSITVSSSTLKNRMNDFGVVYLKVRTDQDGKTYEDVVVITLLEEVDLSGIDVDTYNIQFNYPEILKFYESQNNVATIQFSPNILEIQSFKGEGIANILTSKQIEYEVWLYANHPNLYISTNGGWFKITGDIPEVLYDAATDSYNTTGNLIQSSLEENLITFENSFTYQIDITKITEDKTDSYLMNTIRDIFKNENTALRIKLFDKTNYKLLSTEDISFRYGTSDEMASFSLTAANIQMAVRESKLIFDADGLHVYNGGLDITHLETTVDENGNTIVVSEDKVFYVDDATGDLVLKGTVYADNGSFTGEIDAISGSLGNLSVNGLLNINDKLFINGDQFNEKPIGIYSSDYIDDNDSGFYISADGQIYANQLTLGAGANIKKYIRLGNGWIINPTWLNNELLQDIPETVVTENNLTKDSFLTVKNEQNDLINIKQNGTIIVGQDGVSGVKIDGVKQSISTFNYTDGYRGWSISPNEAEFNNVTIRGSIKASSMEYEEHSAHSIGGIVLVKPSTTIKEVAIDRDEEANMILTVESDFMVGENDWIKIGHPIFEDYLLRATNLTPKTIGIFFDSTIMEGLGVGTIADILRQGATTNLVGSPIINMGGASSPSIIINGSESNTLYPKSALSIFTNNIEGDKLNPEVRLVLGQMPQEISDKTYGIFSSNSYGLYSENVFLKGALISEGKSNSGMMYSGMNTNSTVPMFKEDSSDNTMFQETGNIILWAGAPNNGDTGIIDIQSSKFKVDHLGNLYANSGYFVGTIITDATITASKVQAAIIEGLPEKNPDGSFSEKTTALTIRNADVGIRFLGDSDTTIMELSKEDPIIGRQGGLKLYADLNVGDKFTVTKDSGLVVPITYFSNTRASGEDITVITPNRVGFVTSTGDFRDYSQLDYKGYITGNENGLTIFGKNDSAAATFWQEEIDLKRKARLGGRELTFYDEGGDKVRMTAVLDNSNKVVGYDLYIEV